MCDRLPRVLVLVLQLAFISLVPQQVAAWTTESRIRMADMALRVAPTDLVGQIEKHKKQLGAGIRAAAKSDPTFGSDGNPSSISVSLLPLITTEVDRSIASIIEHKPFANIVFQLGVVSYWVASLNDPLLNDDATAERPTYWQDYSAYLEEATSRFSVLFYPHDRQIDSPRALEALLRRSLARSSEMAPRVAADYRRIEYLPARENFDDRSTAFGVGSLAFSHGVSDIAGVLRYIWLRAGGAEHREFPALDQDHLILVKSGSQDH